MNKMMLITGIAMVVGLAAAIPLAPIQISPSHLTRRQVPGNPLCLQPVYQSCLANGTMIRCMNGVAELFTCTGGCMKNCPGDWQCLPPTCNGAVPVG